MCLSENSFGQDFFKSYEVAGQHPGLKSIDFLGTAKGHGISSWAPGVPDKGFFGGACVFNKLLCRVAYDLHCGCLCCCPVFVSPGIGDEFRDRLQLWSQMEKGGQGTRTRKEENEKRNVAETSGEESEGLGKWPD